jgi:tetratricopeptide (TPR) repeat protein
MSGYISSRSINFRTMITHQRTKANPKPFRWILGLFLLGLPMTSAVLFLAQSDLNGLNWVKRRANPAIDLAYRYRYHESLAAIQSPTQRGRQEIAFFQERVRQNPSGGLDRASLAQAYLKMAQITGEGSWYLLAEQTAQQSLAALPFYNEGAIAVLARVAEARHDFQTALRFAAQVPESDQALAVRVTSNLAIGQLKVASQAADQLVNYQPTIGSYTLRAMVNTAQGKDSQALEDFQAAIAVEEAGEPQSSARTRTLLGRFYYERGQLAQAEALYQEALQIVPRYPQALLNLAQLEIRKGQYAQANRYYEQVATITNGTPTAFEPLILRGKARLQALQGNATQASQLQTKAEALLRQTTTGSNDRSFGHQRDLARILLERGQPQDVAEALTLMRAEVKIRQDADTLDTLAWALAQSGRWQEAQTTIQAAIQLGTRDAGIWHRAATITQASGNREQANTYLQKVKAIDPQFDDRAQQAIGLGVGLGS